MANHNNKTTPSVFAGRAWQQVLARDASADGQFVYAVKSTKIYCRPSCPSRRPERKNVSFFPTPALAEAAGFRPCLRCEPQRTTPKQDPQAAAIAKAAEFLTEHASQRTRLDDLATAAGLGKFALQRGFKRVLGVTPGDFAREQRKERFRDKVRKPKLSITDAVYEAGFGSPSRLYEDIDQTLGMTPTAMKAGGAGEIIHYATTDSPLGRLLVATTARGLCAVLFADSEAEAAAELRERFPQAALRIAGTGLAGTGLAGTGLAGTGLAGTGLAGTGLAGTGLAGTGRAGTGRDLAAPEPGLAEAVRFVLSHLRETPTAATLPFHVRATAFQQRVWRALLDIPRGETRTYAQIAAAVGSPKAVRAVGTACGSNLLAVVVPCHRVVGADGRLTGYRWGIERKRQLLELERNET
jgi:AraC family transcriptional regulator of adaptative response/methylated-DNA-[protein]-cysteine methyltransferase